MKLTALFAVLSLLLAGCTPPASVIRDANNLLYEDFNASADSGLAKALLANPHITLARGAGPDGSNAIRVEYVGYQQGSKRVLARYPLTNKVAFATLSFDVRFDRDFIWQLGGKLHGLGPRNLVTGGSPRRPDGWSARIMFRPEGRCSTYLYDQTKDKKYGISQATDNPVFTAGQWQHVEFQVRLNDPGKANGFARIMIDNREVVSSRNVVFREQGGASTRIQKFLFSTFHGGNTPKWMPIDSDGNPATVYAWFDNFTVTTGYLHW